jgi:IS5 family transposase
MGQFGFFDADRRLAAITAKGDPLEMIARVVPFESFRAEVEAAVLTPANEKKSSAGRKPINVMVMFRMLVLQSLYKLSDEQVEYQVRDRLSFTGFLGLGIEDGIPDGTTLWLFRETLAKARPIENLFEGFGQHLEAKGYIARGGQMVDATIALVPKQRNSRGENDDVKVGKTPEAWEKSLAKNRQKDKDARWTKKHGKSFYGYKNHVNADAKHKLIRQYDVTDASVHDSQKFWTFEPSQYVCKCVRGQRVSLGEDRGEAQLARLVQPDSSAREPQSSAGAGEREPPEEQSSGPHRTRARKYPGHGGARKPAQHQALRPHRRRNHTR